MPRVGIETESAMDCEYHARLNAYHDGELPEAAAREMRRHVEKCPACAAELAEIEEVSRAFRPFLAADVPFAVLRRAHEAADAAADGARSPVVRVAGVLTALAASVLVIASAWLWDAPPAGIPAPAAVAVMPAPEWERVAMTLDTDPLPGEAPDAPGRTALADARLADWMVQHLGAAAQGAQ